MNNIFETPFGRLLYLSAVIGGSPPVERTATGNPVTFETDLAKPLKSLIANFLPVQDSGTPSPENVLPITGRDAVNVFHAGKNLFSTTLEQGAISANNGSDSGSDYRVRSVGFIHLSAGKYTVSAVGVGQAFFYVYDTNGQYIQSESSAGFTNIPRTLTLVGDRYVRIAFRVSSNNENVTPSDVSNVQLEVGETASTYEAPSVTAYPATFPSTIYGGYVDLVTGEVWGTWGEIESYDGETLTGKWKSDRDVYSVGGTPTTGAQVVYEIESPVLITILTPQQINAIKGNNTVWSDGNGDCEVTYLVSAAYAEDHPVGGLGSGLLGFGSGNPDPDEPGEPDQPDEPAEPDQPGDDQPEEQ